MSVNFFHVRRTSYLKKRWMFFKLYVIIFEARCIHEENCCVYVDLICVRAYIISRKMRTFAMTNSWAHVPISKYINTYTENSCHVI